MLGLVLASSCAPSLFRPSAQWDTFYHRMIDGVTQPAEAAQETPEVIEGYLQRNDKAFTVLRRLLEHYEPDALVVVGHDGGLFFDPVHVPQMYLFRGPQIVGTDRFPAFGEEPQAGSRSFPCRQDLAQFLLRELLNQEFDLSHGEELNPPERPGPGIANAFFHPLPKVLPSGGLPIVPIYLNCYVAPGPGGRRCYQLGRAIARALAEWEGRVALYAAGGLSGDPFGPRAGWIDVLLDRWVLERLERGRGAELAGLYDLDSDTVRGATGELRCWIVAAGAAEAVGKKATVVDYFPAYKACVGVGFVYWGVSEPTPRRRTRRGARASAQERSAAC